MSRTVVFVHGGWVTPACWTRSSPTSSATIPMSRPAWPGKDRPVETIRDDPSPLAGLGIGEIVDHYERIIRSLDEPPILVGHSFGGLFVQLLVDRGLGAVGIAIDSAPPKGVFAFEPTTLLSLGRILLIPFGWRKVVRWSYPSIATPSSTRCRPTSSGRSGMHRSCRTQAARSSRAGSRCSIARARRGRLREPGSSALLFISGRRTGHAAGHRPTHVPRSPGPRRPGRTSVRSRAGPTG